MSKSSLLGGDAAAPYARGRDVDALGPSDSSDSGSDVQGERTMATEADNPGELGGLPVELGSDSDSGGTGERASATGRAVRDGADILPDSVIDSPVDAPDPDAMEGMESLADLAADEPYDLESDPDGADGGADSGGDGGADDSARRRRAPARR